MKHTWEELDVPDRQEEHLWDKFDNKLFLAFDDEHEVQPWNQHYEVCTCCGASRSVSRIPQGAYLRTYIQDIYPGDPSKHSLFDLISKNTD